ncbi:unnamed protein product [Arctogadus glacialis]
MDVPLWATLDAGADPGANTQPCFHRSRSQDCGQMHKPRCTYSSSWVHSLPCYECLMIEEPAIKTMISL